MRFCRNCGCLLSGGGCPGCGRGGGSGCFEALGWFVIKWIFIISLIIGLLQQWGIKIFK